MHKPILLAIITMFVSNVWGQAQIRELTVFLEDEAAATELSEKVTELIFKYKGNKAFEEMAPYWPVKEDRIDGLKKKSNAMLKILEDEYGTPIGTHKGQVTRIGDWALEQTYLIRCNYSAIQLNFRYLKSEKGWMMNHFSWDDHWEEELH